MEASEVDEEREGEGVHCTVKLYKNTKLQNVLHIYKSVNIHVCPCMMVL